MTSSEINIAIAEFCGWENIRPYVNPTTKMKATVGLLKGKLNLLPDYYNDLNAMHEAEAKLSDEQWIGYVENLWKLHPKSGRPHLEWNQEVLCNTIWKWLTHATAQQRSTALVKTIGKSGSPEENTKPCMRQGDKKPDTTEGQWI